MNITRTTTFFSGLLGTALVTAAVIPSDSTTPKRPLVGSSVASVEEEAIGLASAEAELLDPDHRFGPTTRPEMPPAVTPPMATTQNVDTGKPVHEWQRATDDWGGGRPWLDDHGIVLQASLAAEYAHNLRGGLNTAGGDFRHLFNANVTLDLDRLAGLKGATVFANFQTQNGDAADDAGDIQGTSNIDADGRSQLSELWYEQTTFDGAVRIKIGKIDANTEFAYVSNAGEFLNSSMGFSPTILGLPTYPDPAFGSLISVTPRDWFYAGLGVFDGAGQEGITTGTRGPKSLFGAPADLFIIGETGFLWKLSGGRDGRIGFGGWRHTGTFDRLDGGTESGTGGYYIVVDQMLVRMNPDDENDGRGIGAYLQYGHADQSVSEIHNHVGCGIAWTGMLPGRDDDVAGAGITYAELADQLGGEGSETTFEVFYKAQVTPWFSVKPDLQYIHNPGGDSDVDDALVATVRAVIDF